MPKNAADARNAAAEAAGSPRRATRVPGGVILRSAGIVTARPITTSGTLQTDRSVRPASSAPAPTISTSEATIGRLERSSLVSHVPKDRHHEHGRERDRRQGDQERPPPADRLRDEGAERRPEQPRQDPHRGEQRHDARPDVRGVGLRDRAERDRVQATAADPLHEPRDDQDQHRGRRGGEDEPHDVEGDRDPEDRAWAEPVRHAPRDRHRDERRERQRHEDPPVQAQPVQVGLDRGQDRRHDHDLDRDERLEQQQAGREPPARAGEDRSPRRRSLLERAHGHSVARRAGSGRRDSG